MPECITRRWTRTGFAGNAETKSILTKKNQTPIQTDTNTTIEATIENL